MTSKHSFRPRGVAGWLAALGTLGTLGDTVRLRQRLQALPVLEPAGAAIELDDVVFIRTDGVQIPDAVQRAAAAHLERLDLAVVDLVPPDLPVDDLFDLLRRIDPATYRTSPLVKGTGALQALAVRRDVARRAGLVTDRPLDPVEMVLATVRCKHMAPRDTDLVVAPGLTAVPLDDEQRLAVLRATVGAGAPLAVFAKGLPFTVALAAGRNDRTWSGALGTAAAFQSLAAVLGTSCHPADLDVLRLPGRLGVRANRAVRVLRGRWESDVLVPADPRSIDRRRPVYADLLAQGTDRFFEERRENCPLCGSTALDLRLETTDLLQRKPGVFRLDECRTCGHIFQNPRLSIEGLDFYYRDFYDGLGEADTDGMFAISDRAYRDRARMVARHTTPKRWLDVGGGHGHFCLIAAEELPGTHFDGLDMSDSIDEAAARGWIEQAHRGMFPDVAGDMAGSYDVVSMHHYLEHTRDPIAELDAAHVALAPDGLLLIEVPHIQSRFAKLLGRWWLPWFQPQHQHYLSVENLTRALDAHGFDVVDVEVGPAHQPADIGGATWLATQAFAPAPDLPWLDPPTLVDQVRRGVTLVVGGSLAALGLAADLALAPMTRSNDQWSNAFRVVARRRD